MTTKITLFITLLTFLMFLGCSSSKAVKKIDDKNSSENKSSENSKNNLQPVTKDDLTIDELAQVKKVLEELKDIPFNFDNYNIPTEGLDIIKKNVQILNQMLEERGKFIKIVLQGHTDERGSNEYNLALGERRAKTVKDYLLSIGFLKESLRVISFGEEHPKDAGTTVESWAANRRVHILVE